MRHRVSLFIKLFAIFLLAIGWVFFLILEVIVIDRLREFPGWSEFLVFDLSFEVPLNERRLEQQTSNTSLILLINSSPDFNTGAVTEALATSAATATSTPALSKTTAVLPLTQPVIQPTPPQINYPTRCANSVETRFALGRAGYTDPQRNVRLRPTPGSGDGTRLAPSTRFVTIGTPVCADLYGYDWNNYLWWPVRITDGSAEGRTGWLAESVVDTNGRVHLHMFPN